MGAMELKVGRNTEMPSLRMRTAETPPHLTMLHLHRVTFRGSRPMSHQADHTPLVFMHISPLLCLVGHLADVCVCVGLLVCSNSFLVTGGVCSSGFLEAT